MDQSPRLALPYLLPGQAQKHVTHNEALRTLDALVHLSVKDRDVSAPPVSPEEGACWLVGAGASGDWAGHDNDIAAFQDGAWTFLSPGIGWQAYIADEDSVCVWTGAVWRQISLSDAVQNLSQLGIGTQADAANPFAAKLNTALWTARFEGEGGDGNLRYTLNKEASAKTLSLLMQTGWSGRAEIGLTGDDDLHVKVSGDGANWTEAMVLGHADGRARFPAGLAHAETGLDVAQYIPSPVREVWRVDTPRPGTPRTYAVAAVSGTTLTLTAPQVSEIYTNGMQDNVAVRIWNISKSPAQAAWVDWNLTASELRVTDAAHIAGWTAGDTLQLGDPNPTDDNVLGMVALDISGYLFNQLGAVFPQKGLMAAVYASSGDGPASLGLSTNGALGSVFGGNALSNGSPNRMAFAALCNVPSPISNSHLVFLREQLDGGASDVRIAYVRVLGVYV